MSGALFYDATDEDGFVVPQAKGRRGVRGLGG